MHTAEIAAQVTAAAQELLKIGAVKAGQVLVVGCSTSEVIGDKIGTAGSMKVAEAMFAALIKVTEVHGVFLAIQCCEHLNRALVTTRYAAEKLWLAGSYCAACTACRRRNGDSSI